ncbi:triphosphoribosyl-dephospho-CoA synthase [Vibrio mimicus]
MLLTLLRPGGFVPWRDLVFRAALSALHEEPIVWPRFGLVGPTCTGSHSDMNYHLLRCGAEPVAHYAADAFELGRKAMGTPQEFARLRQQGISAECDMLAATGGINTHKGSIFLLGLLSFALGHVLQYNTNLSVANLLAWATAQSRSALIADLVEKSRSSEESYGEWAFRKYGLLGVRGHAINGFGDLYRALHWLSSFPDVPIRALYGHLRLFFLSRCDDTNMVKRAGLSRTLDFRQSAIEALSAGSMFHKDGFLRIQRLEGRMQQARVSAAASGDMMILVIFFERLGQYGFLNWKGHPEGA